MSNVARVGSFRRGLSILTAVVWALAGSKVAHATTPQIVINSAKVQIVLSPTNSKNAVNLSTTFTNNGDDACAGDDALNDGVSFVVASPSCAFPINDLAVGLAFVVHTIGHQSYGTYYSFFFNLSGIQALSAKITALPTPAGTCGQWRLNFESTGTFFTGPFDIGDSLALFVRDEDGDESCLDLPASDTIIGNPPL